MKKKESLKEENIKLKQICSISMKMLGQLNKLQKKKGSNMIFYKDKDLLKKQQEEKLQLYKHQSCKIKNLLKIKKHYNNIKKKKNNSNCCLIKKNKRYLNQNKMRRMQLQLQDRLPEIEQLRLNILNILNDNLQL